MKLVFRILCLLYQLSDVPHALQATYVRLLYTKNNVGDSAAPLSCLRTVTGTAVYEVIGWWYSRMTVGGLLLATVLNSALATLLVMILWFSRKPLETKSQVRPELHRSVLLWSNLADETIFIWAASCSSGDTMLNLHSFAYRL